jgi:hypothetical protein
MSCFSLTTPGAAPTLGHRFQLAGSAQSGQAVSFLQGSC